jgi:cell pole-organizing protein PopZ
MTDTPKDPSQPVSSDPSMEDILASIRRILSEEETHDGTSSAPAGAYDDDVLILDSSMMVQVPSSPATETTNGVPMAPPAEHPAPAAASSPVDDSGRNLVAPEVAAAAASSVGSLVRNIAAERSMQVHTGGPTIEDIVRAELRPLLKQWLDANLETLVERLVRAELERVVSRALS